MSDFSLIDTLIGEYNWKSDGTNTTSVNGNRSTELCSPWLLSAEFLDWRRRKTVVAPEVQLAAGVTYVESGLSISQLLARIRQDHPA